MTIAHQEIITGITHPQVAAMYVRHEERGGVKADDVLVIETWPHDEGELEMHGRDEYILDLLLDLQELRAQVEAKAGPVSRIDIRWH